MSEWIWNPKTEGSGIITCVPQDADHPCPNQCDECWAYQGRSYLEPLSENLPHIPTQKMAEGRIVRMNDLNDSNNQRELVEQVAAQYDDAFFNTASMFRIGEFSRPVVLTANPQEYTDFKFQILDPIPPNLMFVRLRTNLWNIDTVVKPAVEYYTSLNVPVVLTWMAYYETPIPDKYRPRYGYRKRTLNSYWCIRRYAQKIAEEQFEDNPLVYSCGYKDTHSCMRCGNCVREYMNTKERMRKVKNSLTSGL